MYINPGPNPRDAIGLGASMSHPRESEEWKNMTMRQVGRDMA